MTDTKHCRRGALRPPTAADGVDRNRAIDQSPRRASGAYRAIPWPRPALRSHAAIARRMLAMLSLLSVGLLSVGGCKPAKDQNVAARAAAKAFVGAMVSGDETAMRSASSGDEASAKLFAATARKNAASEKLSAIVAKKYGDTSLVIRPRGHDYVGNRMQTIDAEPISINGETATIGNPGDQLLLRRQGDVWKVDRMAQIPPGAADDPSQLVLLDAMRRAYDDVAAAIEAADYSSAADAREALESKITAAVRESMRGTPTTKEGK